MQPTKLCEGLTREDILRRLKDSKLLSVGELDRAETANPDADSAAIASGLVAAGILTSFQVEAICQDRLSDLTIGNYEVLDRLGAGGMGTVFKARHRRMKRIVALKVLAASLSKDDTFVQRFQREVETIAQLSHANIVMAFDADEDAVGHFLVMEFVDGHDLASMVQKKGPLSVHAAVHCVLQAARGLEYAHAQGIIHRDIKPANLLRDEAGVVKVTDLGLARFNNAGVAGGETAAVSSLTQAGGILGTADYMPPEQAVDSTTIDHRADIYSLGATLYFLLIGKPPYFGQSMMATLLKHRDAPIPLLGATRHDVPRALDEVFAKMLAKQPGDRQQTMTEVVRDLEAVLAALSEVSAAPRLEVDVSDSNRPTDAQDAQRTVVAPAAAAADQTLGGALGPLLKQIKVLLVEPSRTQCWIILRLLQALDIMHIRQVATGQDALKAVRAEAADAILSAMHLADMTGVELAGLVRGESRLNPPGFVLISSESESKEAGLLIQSGQAVILHKPFTAEELVQALRLSSPRLSALKPPSGATVAAANASMKPPSGAKIVTTAAPVAAAERGAYRVLIVDDSAAARLHERSVLKGLGFGQFLEAADGAQAVAVLATEKIDLIVTDYNMPHLDGRGLVGYLKQNAATASVPIIMVTTEQDPAKLEAVRQLGVAAVCDKNFQPEVMRKIIDQLF